MIGIYKIINPNGLIYVGQSKDIENRWEIYKTKDFRSQPKLFDSMLTYGWINHIFEIIEECSIEDLNCRERHWQDFYDVKNKGLNCILIRCGSKPEVYIKYNRKFNFIEDEVVFEEGELFKDLGEGCKKRILFNPDYQLSGKDKQSMSSTQLRKAEAIKNTKNIISCATDWDFLNLGKISQSKIAKQTGLGISTVKRRTEEIKKVFKILNSENLHS